MADTNVFCLEIAMHESSWHPPTECFYLVPTGFQEIALRDDLVKHGQLAGNQRGIGKTLHDVVARQAQLLQIVAGTTVGQPRASIGARCGRVQKCQPSCCCCAMARYRGRIRLVSGIFDKKPAKLSVLIFMESEITQRRKRQARKDVFVDYVLSQGGCGQASLSNDGDTSRTHARQPVDRGFFVSLKCFNRARTDSPWMQFAPGLHSRVLQLVWPRLVRCRERQIHAYSLARWTTAIASRPEVVPA